MFNLNEYLMRGRYGQKFFRCPRIVCADGFSISVQANKAAYCSPRNDFGPWTRAECGFPSEKPDALMEYCEDNSKPTQTVYAYVPAEVIERLIDSHCGIAEPEKQARA